MTFFCLVACLLNCGIQDAAGGTDEAGAEFFEKRVRPLLAEQCYECHSTKSKKVKAGLLVDNREGLIKGGESGPAVVARKPEQSRLIEAVRYSSPELQMPPRGRLSDEQVAALVRWVELGAPWSGGGVQATAIAPADRSDMGQRRATHWAWQPVRALAPPAVKDEGWVRSRVDRFILARLEAAGLRPAPPADRRSLLRRIHFALLGLPPTPEQVEEFLQDQAPDALERVVDRLLASPHFGERWARHWMDLVRYSDTLGNEADMLIPNAWRYRDYLVRAFNADLPYHKLILEHLGGDLLDEPRRLPDGSDNESVLGTAFFWMTEGKRSPVDLRQAQADSFDNRLDVLGKTFLGLTIACARCHDHKFDPVTQEDYYGLYGYLKSSRYTQTLLNRVEIDAAAARMAALRIEIGRATAAAWARRAALIPRYLVAALRIRSDEDVARVSRCEGLQPDRSRLWAKAAKESAPDPGHPMYAWRRIAELGSEPTREAVAARWREIQLETRATRPITMRRKADIVLADFGRSGFRGWFVEDQAFGAATLRPGEVLLGKEAARPVATLARGGAWAQSGHLSRRLQGTLRSPSFSIDRRFLHVLAAGRASRVNVVIEHFVMIQDPLYGRLRRILNDDTPRWLTFDLEMWRGKLAYVEFADTTTQDLHDMGPPAGCGPDGYLAVGNVLLSDQGPPPLPSTVAAIGLLGDEPVDSPRALAERYGRAVTETLGALADGSLPERSDAEARSVLLAWFIEHGLLELEESATKPIGALLESFREIEARLPEPRRAPAMTEGTPEDERVFLRGNPNTVGPVVPRRMLSALESDRVSPSRAVGSGRLDLARRIADPANPLTARVAVNRIWHHVFGRGLVASVDNFGALGDRPSHPELLDDLADRFVRDGWSIKRVARELVLSSTFRMASSSSPEAEAADPDNRLMHRMFVRRLEAECIRDAILAVSGRLEGRMGGPGVEVHLTPFMDNYTDSYGRPKASGPLDGDGRRSLYLNVRRNFLTPMLVAFDMPPPLVTAGRRDVSNVPAQALILMNDPFVAQQARRWAVRVLAIEGLDASGRIRRMYREAFARPPSQAELKTAVRFLESHATELGIPPERRGNDEQVWADLAHVLINVKEFIFLD